MKQITIIFIFFSLYAAGDDSETIDNQEPLVQNKNKVALSCKDRQTFNDQYKNILNGKSIISLLRKENIIGKGIFGAIYKVNWGGKEAVVKIMGAPTLEEEILSTNLEIELSKKLGQIGVSMEFKDCVEISDYVLLVQEKLFKDLESVEVTNKFYKMSVIERLRSYSEIAGKFEKMHKEGYVHQDIKPANIMVKNADISDFRIIDFGMSSLIEDPVIGGSLRYCTPEKILAINREESEEGDIATVHQDIYALALTFAVMEGSELSIFGQTKNQVNPQFQIVGKPIDLLCFKREMTEECFEILKANIFDTLYARNNLDFFEIIVSAMENRNIATMQVFMNRIDELILYLESEMNPHISQQQVEIQVQNVQSDKTEMKKLI